LQQRDSGHGYVLLTCRRQEKDQRIPVHQEKLPDSEDILHPGLKFIDRWEHKRYLFSIPWPDYFPDRKPGKFILQKENPGESRSILSPGSWDQVKPRVSTRFSALLPDYGLG